MLDSLGDLPLVCLRIRKRLKEIDRSKEWLAGRLSVDASLVHRWLTGERPIPELRLREIALVLHRPQSWFTAPEEDLPAAV